MSRSHIIQLNLLCVSSFVIHTYFILTISQFYLSTSSLIRPSYTIRATIFEKVFWPEKFPKTKYFPTKRIKSLSSRTCKFSSRTCKLLMACLPSLLEITALIASLLCREGKQAIISSQEGKQAIKSKEGAIKCCKEKKITAPPNEWRNIPIKI